VIHAVPIVIDVMLLIVLTVIRDVVAHKLAMILKMVLGQVHRMTQMSVLILVLVVDRYAMSSKRLQKISLIVFSPQLLHHDVLFCPSPGQDPLLCTATLVRQAFINCIVRWNNSSTNFRDQFK
jgi:hypothetical protein